MNRPITEEPAPVARQEQPPPNVAALDLSPERSHAAPAAVELNPSRLVLERKPYYSRHWGINE